MAKVDFHYIKTGTGELSGPSFVEQTELAINELGVFIEDVENTAESALDTANKAQTAADTAQTTADTALSQAQQAQASADAAQQAADQAQTTADNALEAAQNAGDAADTKAPIMHASTATTYGVGSSTLYGHVQLSDATTGTQSAASGGTASTPYAVAQAMTAAQAAQSTATSAQQVGQSAQQAANTAQSTAEAAQNTADSVQNSLNQSVETFTQQIAALTQQPYFQAQATSINAQDYAGQLTRLYLESTASSSTGLPAGITYPCYFWTEATRDGNTTMMFVLSGNTLYSQTGLNSTPDSDTPAWSFSGWQKITHTAATTSALGVVRPDGTTTEVAADGTLSINTDLLSTVYKFKGSVATMDDLPAGAAQGDVYNVTATDANYAWTGSAWDNIGGIEAVDSAPVQGSTNPVSSGGVYTALANQKSELEEQISQATSGLTPDNVTMASSGGKLRVKDVAIGGDASDLASARGQIGDCQNLLDPDFHTILKSGVWRVFGSNQKNAPGDFSLNAILISNATKDGAYCSHIYIRTLESNAIWVETYHANEGWQPWRRVALDDNFDASTMEWGTGGSIVAKDIAIGGDTGDLASKRGFFYDQYVPWWGGSTTAAYAVTDFDEFTTPGVYHIRWREGTPYVDSNDVTWPVTLNNPNAGNGGSWWYDGILEVSQVSSATYTSSWARLQHRLLVTTSAAGALGKIFVRAQAVNSSRTWSAWTTSITDADIGDGITVNNGIISVPEYEGATSSAAGTAGLVPPAAKGAQNRPLRGDGTWASSLSCDITGHASEDLPLSGGTLTGRLSSSHVTLIETTNWPGIAISDTSRTTSATKMLTVVLDKDGRRFWGEEVTANTDGSRGWQLTTRKRDDSGWGFPFKVTEKANGSIIAQVNSKNIVRSVNGVNADDNGNVTLTLNTGPYITYSSFNAAGQRSWLREWSNNVRELGGYAAGQNQTVTLPRAFADANYYVFICPEGGASEIGVTNLTTSSFTVVFENTSNSGFFWHARGKYA